MKTVSDNFAAQFFCGGNSMNAPIDGSVLSRIGEDLRHLYGEVGEGEMPQMLRSLAERIDERRSSERRDD